MHATSPTKAGESYTITYSCNVQLFIVKCNYQDCVTMSRKCTVILQNDVTIQKTYVLHSRSKND